MFTRLGDTYRRIRNTLRILLGNLFDFPVAALYERRRRSQTAATEDLTLIDRWILERLDHVIADCRSAYETFEFHKVYHTLNQFCAVDLSSLPPVPVPPGGGQRPNRVGHLTDATSRCGWSAGVSPRHRVLAGPATRMAARKARTTGVFFSARTAGSA